MEKSGAAGEVHRVEAVDAQRAHHFPKGVRLKRPVHAEDLVVYAQIAQEESRFPATAAQVTGAAALPLGGVRA